MKVFRKRLSFLLASYLLTFNVLSFSVASVKPISAQEPASTTDFVYSAGGQRIAKVENGGYHTYYLPGVEVIVDGDEVSYRRYYAFNGSVAVRDNNGINYTHSDQLGSTSVTTDPNGNLVGSTTYFPFGLTRETFGTIAGERLYTGQVSDQDSTGLYYYNARYYSPAMGRFTQADTASDGQNKYAYVGNNPINATDPTGHFDGPPPTESPQICADWDIRCQDDYWGQMRGNRDIQDRLQYVRSRQDDYWGQMKGHVDQAPPPRYTSGTPHPPAELPVEVVTVWYPGSHGSARKDENTATKVSFPTPNPMPNPPVYSEGRTEFPPSLVVIEIGDPGIDIELRLPHPHFGWQGEFIETMINPIAWVFGKNEVDLDKVILIPPVGWTLILSRTNVQVWYDSGFDLDLGNLREFFKYLHIRTYPGKGGG